MIYSKIIQNKKIFLKISASENITEIFIFKHIDLSVKSKIEFNLFKTIILLFKK